MPEVTVKDEIDRSIYEMRGLISYLGRHADKIDDEDQRDLEQLREEFETLLRRLRFPILAVAS